MKLNHLQKIDKLVYDNRNSLTLLVVLLFVVSLLVPAIYLPVELRTGIYNNLTSLSIIHEQIFGEYKTETDRRIKYLEQRIDLLSEIQEQRIRNPGQHP